ncbi:MAG: FliG C-terminal domain-containing protein [Treponema sp.]
MANINEIMKEKGLIKVPVEKEKDNPYRKVAKFLFIIGASQASRVIKSLSSDQVDKIIAELVTIQTIGKDEAEEILKEFSGLYDKAKLGGIETARDMLEKAFGKEKAEKIINNNIPEEKKISFEYLKDIDNETLSVLLEGEMTSTKALILSQLPAKQVAKYISNAEDKKDIIKAMLDMKKVSADILFEVAEAMRKKMSKIKISTTSVDGKNSLLNILRSLDYKAGEEIINSIAESDAMLAKELKENVFTIDDIITIPDFQLQKFLFDFDDDSLTKLIHGKSESFRNKILSNLSGGRGKRIEEEEKMQELFLKKDVKEATNKFMQKIRDAQGKGELEILIGDDAQWV